MSIDKLLQKLSKGMDELSGKLDSLAKKRKEETISKDSQKYGNASTTAKRYGVHANTVRNWYKSGYIHKHIVHGVSLYSFAEIDNFIKSKAA